MTVFPNVIPDKQFEVAAVIGLASSGQAVMTSSVLSLFKIPHLSLFATSDELNDVSRFEYFVRLVPTDRLQV